MADRHSEIPPPSQRAEREREHLLMAVEQAAESIFITDPAGLIEYVNPAFERTTGYSRAEALGKNPRILKSGAQAPELYDELWATIASGRTWSGRMTNRRKDGSLFTEDATISPVLGPDGAVQNYVAVKHDVTASLRMEAQFLQAQKMETVGRLAGGVAHDFNNMLGVIFSLTELELANTDPSQPLYASLRSIQNAAQRSADLTRQLLTFARKQPVTPQLLDLNATVGAMLGMLGRLIGEQIDLRWEPQAGLGWVRMDPVQLDQVIVNLCVNARDAINGVGELRLATEVAELDESFCAARPGLRPGAHVLLRVRDNGSGMDAATLSQVFEPFFSTKGLGKGSGLGLATVYGIVTQNRGYIEAASAPGQGASFSIYLPRHSQGPTPPPPPPGETLLRPAQSTILLVEDEPALLSLTCKMLERMGHRVLPARNPAEALKLARGLAGSVHLLLTDVVMPGMNGVDLAGAVLKLHPEMRCLYMSGYSADIVAKQGVMDDRVHFLAKPFTSAELSEKIRETIKQ